MSPIRSAQSAYDYCIENSESLYAQQPTFVAEDCPFMQERLSNDNWSVLDSVSYYQVSLDDPTRLRPGLKWGEHYKGLHGIVWQGLFALYGGGPPIVRPTLGNIAATLV